MSQRRSDRVSLSVSIEVSGITTTGRHFREKAKTLVVNAQGATIVLGRKLAPGQPITVRCPLSGKEASARVIGQIEEYPNRRVYGVVLLDPTLNLWNIQFPSLAETEKGFVRLLLECAGCQAREVVTLDELEAEVYEVSRSLSRPCNRCCGWTLWKLALHEKTSKHAMPRVPPRPAVRTRNERKHIRVSLKMTACIRHPGFGDDVVQVENISRGGFQFASPDIYGIGLSIEVAAPYTPGAANVFVPARIVRRQELQDRKLKRYGVEFMNTYEEWPR